jgi:hypothetical protein
MSGSFLRIFYAVWGGEALYSSEVTAWSNIYDIEYSRQKYGYVLNQVGFDLGMMFAIGSAYRLLAFILLMRSSISSSISNCCICICVCERDSGTNHEERERRHSRSIAHSVPHVSENGRQDLSLEG